MATSAWAETYTLECATPEVDYPEDLVRITFNPELANAEIKFLRNGQCPNKRTLRTEGPCVKPLEVKVFPNFYRFKWTTFYSSGDPMSYFDFDISRTDLTYSEQPFRTDGICKMLEIEETKKLF